jgi:hypothetical protein
MNFSLVKHTGKFVRLEWTSDDGHGTSGAWYESRDLPADDFTQTMQAFAGPVREALDLGDDYALEIRQVSVTFGKEGEFVGIIVSGIHEVHNSTRPFNVHTPLLDLEKFDEFDDLVAQLQEEAEMYFTRRKRVQRDALADSEDVEEGELVGEAAE